MIPEALLLIKNSLLEADSNIAKILEFFGIPWRAETLVQFLARDRTNAPPNLRLFCSSEIFLELITQFTSTEDRSVPALRQLRSVFVYAENNPTHIQQLVRRLTGDDAITIKEPDRCVGEFLVGENTELCGAMAGVRIVASASHPPAFVYSSESQDGANTVISTEHGAIFLKLQYRGFPVFVSTSPRIIDLDSELTSGVFDIRDHVAEALPIVLFVKSGFGDVCWQPAEANASVIIDDPVLNDRYGFLNFEELLPLMKHHRFCSTIAFIPWNCFRSQPKIARLFRENSDVYSLSVHGCDHTGGEFGDTDRERLYRKAKKALERMVNHESETGIGFDRVMVFPQGIFSEAALRALKHTDFIAVSDHGTITVDPVPQKITVRDVWNGAVTAYDGFPIFTRRDPSDGVENFAFDIRLGKPALIGIHHDYCSNHCERLVALVERLNALECRLMWRSLGQVVKRSYWRREPSPGVVEVKMFGAELRIENPADEAKRFIISKRESDPSSIREICTPLRRLPWTFSEDQIRFELELKAREHTTIRVRFRGLNVEAQSYETIPYRLRTMLRRYASELRDNHILTNKLILATRRWSVLPEDMQSGATGAVVSGNGKPSRAVPFTSQRALNSLPDQVSNAVSAFTRWLREYGETSWDHQSFFAGPIGGRAKSLYYRSRWLGTAAVAPMIFCEAFLPSARRVFHHPIRFAIADAHYAMGFGFLYQATAESAHFERAVQFLDRLKASRCREFKEYCWGYPFDWVWRGGVLKAQTPFITTTPYVYEAFLQLWEIHPQEEWKQILESIARHARFDIKDFKTSESASSCSYGPFRDEGGVINAAAYRAFLLTSASRVLSNDEYWKVAERNLNFVLETQNPDGSWFYAVDGRDFVDHFHTCFVLKALGKIYSLTGHKACKEALSKGVAFYLDNLFDEEGLPKPFSKAPRLTVYKRELYDCAECLNLCVLLRDHFPQLQVTLEAVLTGILKDWIKPDGSFRSRRLHLGWDNVPMHRWGQSQMFRSLAYYLSQTGKADEPQTEASNVGKRNAKKWKLEALKI